MPRWWASCVGPPYDNYDNYRFIQFAPSRDQSPLYSFLHASYNNDVLVGCNGFEMQR